MTITITLIAMLIVAAIIIFSVGLFLGMCIACSMRAIQPGTCNQPFHWKEKPLEENPE